ncbi:hypothetical protein PV327_010677 [Microctonus hyperodae]|uniref:Uncharacterized protein n=1 Tax=Microctonus hyperodae TaxID=165561 RepID=A0AA39C7Y0_MICHY|nr:hypothetical protein PV327_010677 [Microctonus hyperodae]
MSSYISILLILFAVNYSQAINYAKYRVNDTVSIDVSRDTARTTREILEKLNNIQISSADSLQEGIEHLLQFGALIRTRILDIFGKLIYDHYDEFTTNEMRALYEIYQDTLDRKYNIFDIIPNILINDDLSPLAICNYINIHVRTCLRGVSSFCVKTKFPNLSNDLINDTKIIDLTKSLYYSAHIDEKFKHGISLPNLLESLQHNNLQLTIELFSGLLHNIQYDDYDDDVRSAEREIIHYFLKNSDQVMQKHLLTAENIKQYHSIQQLLNGFLNTKQFPNNIKRHAEYLSQHIAPEPYAINENIELLGAVFDDNDVNLKYLFELVLPDDTIDSDVIDAKNYLLEEMLKQDIVEKYLQIEKYQHSNPSQLLMGIFGQLRDIDFITDIATSLRLHAKYYHSSHMVENLNQLVELFDTYENLRGIPEHLKLITIIDRLRKKLYYTKNATIEILCTNPRKCLRIGLKIISQCNSLDKETKRLIMKFLEKSNLYCLNTKHSDKQSKLAHETVSKKPITTTTRKNLAHALNQAEKLTKSSTVLPDNQISESTLKKTKKNCDGEELCEEDGVLPAGHNQKNNSNTSTELNSTTQPTDHKHSSTSFSTHTDVGDSIGGNTTQSSVHPNEKSTHENCSGSGDCLNNNTSISHLPLTTSSDVDKGNNDSSIRHPNHVNITESTLALPSTTLLIPQNSEHTSEHISTTSKPMCQHRDPHYQQKLRRFEKMNKSSRKIVHHNHSASSGMSNTSKASIELSSHVHNKSKLESGENSSSRLGTSEMKKLSDVSKFNREMMKKYHVNEDAEIHFRRKATNKNTNINMEAGVSGKQKKGSEKSESKHTVEAAEHSHSSGKAEHSAGEKIEINLKKGEKGHATTKTEHRKTEHHETSRRNIKNSRHTNKTKKITKNTESSSEKIHESSVHNEDINKKNHLHKINETSTNDNDTDTQNRLFDWNMPLFSNYDIAMNDKPPVDKKNYRSRREIKNTTDKIKDRLFDVNVPLFSNYDLALNDKPPVNKKNYRSRRESSVDKIKSGDMKNHSNDDAKKRLFDFNMPVGSNIDLKANDKPPVNKENYRSRRELNNNKNTPGDIKNSTTDSTLKRLFDFNMPLASNMDLKANDKPPVDKKNHQLHPTSLSPLSTSSIGTVPELMADALAVKLTHAPSRRIHNASMLRSPTFLCLGSIISSTTAQDNLASLATEKITNILSYGDEIFNIIQISNDININRIGKLIVSFKRDNLNIQNLENLQPEIIDKLKCLWKSGWSGNYSNILQNILINGDKHYIEFENFFITNENNDIISQEFIEFTDLILGSYIRDPVVYSYAKFANRTMPELRNGLFDVLADNYDPENNCDVQSIDELFSDIAALYSLVFTKKYTIILMSLKAMQVADIQDEIYSINAFKLLNINPITKYQDLLAEAQKYYKEAITITLESVIKAFIN